MSWSHEQVEFLIQGFQNHPCLYNAKAKNYKNKYSRNEALNSILEIILPIRKDVTISDLKNKWSGLRTNFINEHKKVVSSKRSGCAKDEIYVPSLWYYHKLLFILDSIESRASTDTIQIDEELYTIPEDNSTQNICSETATAEFVPPTFVYEVSEEDENIQLLSPASSGSYSKDGLRPSKQSRKRKAVPDAEYAIIENAATAISNISSVIGSRSTAPKEPTAVAGYQTSFY